MVRTPPHNYDRHHRRISDSTVVDRLVPHQVGSSVAYYSECHERTQPSDKWFLSCGCLDPIVRHFTTTGPYEVDFKMKTRSRRSALRIYGNDAWRHVISMRHAILYLNSYCTRIVYSASTPEERPMCENRRKLVGRRTRFLVSLGTVGGKNFLSRERSGFDSLPANKFDAAPATVLSRISF